MSEHRKHLEMTYKKGIKPKAAEPVVELQGWIVMSSSYEYNDEYNYLTDGGTPLKVHLDEDAARAEATKLQKAWAEDEDPQNWSDERVPTNMFHVVPIKVRTTP